MQFKPSLATLKWLANNTNHLRWIMTVVDYSIFFVVIVFLSWLLVITH